MADGRRPLNEAEAKVAIWLVICGTTIICFAINALSTCAAAVAR